MLFNLEHYVKFSRASGAVNVFQALALKTRGPRLQAACINRLTSCRDIQTEAHPTSNESAKSKMTTT